MTTKPVAWEEQGLVSSVDKGVCESWAQDEVDAAINHSPIMQDKKAPRAEPEEDIDVLDHEALQGNRTLSRTKIADATKLENQNSPIPREAQEVVTELEQVPEKLSETLQSEKPVDECDDAFLPSSPLSALSTEECLEKEAFSSLEGEVAECISDVEILSDAAEDFVSPDDEWTRTSRLTVVVNQESKSEKIIEDNVTADDKETELHFLPDGFDNSECEGAHHYQSGDVYALCSPPFADDSEEEEEIIMDFTSDQQQCCTQKIRNKPFQPAEASVYSEQRPVSVLPVVPSAKQQDELLPKSQCGLAPMGENQEAAQQVQGKVSLPLSTVAMELSNQGRAPSQGFGCAASRVWERTDEESDQRKAVGQQRGTGILRHSKTLQLQEVKTEKYSRAVSFKHSKLIKMESDLCDDSQSDSGVSTDFSPCSTLEGDATTSTATTTKETPIEREIRRAIEREQSLRRSRGLPNPPTSPEYVEIPLKTTVLCQSVTTERCQGKDRQFAGKKMQHEIHEEAQREQDLVKLGKIPGFYDKGTVRQLKERRQLFEAFQTPSDSISTVTARCKTTSWSSTSDISIQENQGVSSQKSHTRGSYAERRQSVDLLSPTESPSVAKGGSTSSSQGGPGFSEETGRQVIILENNLSVPAQKLYHVKRETQPVPTVDSGGLNLSSSRTEGYGEINGRTEEEREEEEEVVPKENPFFKLRSSSNVVKVEQDIREGQEREKEFRRQRISMYGGTNGGDGGGKSQKSSSSPQNEQAVLDLPNSSTQWGTGPSAAQQSVGKLSTWPPPKAEKERTEVLLSPRTPRKKTPLVQRWEAGLVNGHIEDNN